MGLFIKLFFSSSISFCNRFSSVYISGSFLNIADERANCFGSIAGYPIKVLPDFVLPGIPDCAPTFTWSPTFMCPATPTCPPNIHHSPIFADPATPTCDAITVWLPISTLCANWIKLSSFAPLCTTVAPIVARSTHVLAPISTLSSMIVIPIWGIFHNLQVMVQSQIRQLR